MGNFANNVTLETGSTINGALNIGTSTSATLTLTGGGSQIYSGAVTGATTFSGSLIKNGSGTWTLDQAFTYTQATTVSGGTLLVSGSISGSTTGASGTGSTLGGTGTVGAVNVGSGAILEGGDGSLASGALTSGGNVSLASGACIELTLGPGATNSGLARTGGNWSFDPNQAFVFNLEPGAGPGIYDNLITGLTGNEAGLANISHWTIATSGVTGSFRYDGAGDVDLTLTAVPEPATAALFVAGLPLLGLRRRRRR
jgi:autotransporter-associated beta strand protein